jgi:hypothetical protein
MVVFDACFAGQIWKPATQTQEETAEYKPNKKTLQFTFGFNSFGQGIGSSMNFVNTQDDFDPLVYAKTKMKNRSRIIFTSGDEPVLDSWVKPDGTISEHSPFADAFIRALQTKGNDGKVLISTEFIPFIDKLKPQSQRGKLSGSDADFVFILSDKKPVQPVKDSR